MEDRIIAFIIWANAKVEPIEDVKGYNRALGILWCVYGVLFTLIGLPLLMLDEKNADLMIIPVLGAMFIKNSDRCGRNRDIVREIYMDVKL